MRGGVDVNGRAASSASVGVYSFGEADTARLAGSSSCSSVPGEREVRDGRVEGAERRGRGGVLPSSASLESYERVLKPSGRARPCEMTCALQSVRRSVPRLEDPPHDPASSSSSCRGSASSVLLIRTLARTPDVCGLSATNEGTLSTGPLVEEREVARASERFVRGEVMSRRQQAPKERLSHADSSS
ncbi:hypothetical protein AAT19DRAFT_9453 [Rhodotorula toruloides]|uniref:Uncharacterized protein n=1 Tax=Rhodotorula toruloides TaxID=5286 RepID=A0A2T0A280_RHOTO|nr:hypothetical protein AAT19DRAFT_9453 [Rhodotorula toruloides]